VAFVVIDGGLLEKLDQFSGSFFFGALPASLLAFPAGMPYF